MPSLPKLADANFVIGFLLPAFAAFLLAVLIAPEAAAIFPPLRVLVGEEHDLASAFYMVLAVWITAVLLTTTNRLQFQILEGYLPPFSWMRFLRRRKQDRYIAMSRRLLALTAEAAAPRPPGQGPVLAPADEASRLRMKLAKRFPFGHPELVLPTRFGNAIRAFETYPNVVYGADGVLVWPRLTAVIPRDFAKSIDEAKAQVDCFVNLAYVAFLLAGLAGGKWLLLGAPEAASLLRQGRVGEVPARVLLAHPGLLAASLGLLLLSYLAYRWAAARVGYWGELVRSAFDCYLPALARQLGYVLPPDQDERGEFWREFSSMVAYLHPLSKRRWRYAGPSSARAEAEDAAGEKEAELPEFPSEDAAPAPGNGDTETTSEVTMRQNI